MPSKYGFHEPAVEVLPNLNFVSPCFSAETLRNVLTFRRTQVALLDFLYHNSMTHTSKSQGLIQGDAYSLK